MGNSQALQLGAEAVSRLVGGLRAAIFVKLSLIVLGFVAMLAAFLLKMRSAVWTSEAWAFVVVRGWTHRCPGRGDRLPLPFARELLAHVPKKHGPHLGVGAEQDLKVLIVQKFDLGTHVVEQAVHVIEVQTHTAEVVGRLSCGSDLGLRHRRRSSGGSVGSLAA